MNITKEKVAKLLDFVEAYAGVSPEHECATILRGLEDAEPVAWMHPTSSFSVITQEQKDSNSLQYSDEFLAGHTVPLYTSPQAAQTEGKPIEALAPTEAQEHPAYPEGDVGGPCVCGSWPGGKCLRCEWLTEAGKLLQQALEANDLVVKTYGLDRISLPARSATAIRTYLESKG